MTSHDRAIFMAHLYAVNERRLNYKDPHTGEYDLQFTLLQTKFACHRLHGNDRLTVIVQR